MTTEKTETQPENLSFSEVLEFIRDGDNIAWRQDWQNTFINVNELNNYGPLFTKYNTETNVREIYELNHKDIMAKDWKVQFHDIDNIAFTLNWSEQIIEAECAWTMHLSQIISV